MPIAGHRCGAGFTLDHELDSLGPSCDHAVEREGGRLAAFHGGVEELPIGSPSGVVDADGIGGFRFLIAGSFFDDFGG